VRPTSISPAHAALSPAGGECAEPGVPPGSRGVCAGIDAGAQAIVRVDGLGQLEVLTSAGQLVYPTGVAYDPAEAVVWVIDPDAQRLLRVDPVSGSQQIVYEGSPFEYPTGVALAPNGSDLLVMDPDARLLWRVDPVLGSAVPELPMTGLPFPTDLVVLSSGGYGVSDADAGAVFEVDPNSAVATLLAGPHGVTGETLTGDLLVADADRPAFVRVEPASGTSTLEAGALGLSFPTGISYVPEPAHVLQLLVGACGLLVLRCLPRGGAARSQARRAI